MSHASQVVRLGNTDDILEHMVTLTPSDTIFKNPLKITHLFLYALK